MFSNMLRTLGVRVSTALISLMIVVVSGRALGAEVLGSISLMIVSITIINLVGGFAGGAALVYLIPRHKGKALMPVAQLWAIISGLVTASILYLIRAFPTDLVLHVFVLGIVGSLIQNYLSVILVHQRIKWHNAVSLLQAVLMIGMLFVLTYVLQIKSIEAYVWAMYAAYLPVLIVTVLICRNLKLGGQGSPSELFRILFGYGSLVQISSILALLTYRLTYYYTEAWLGLAALGILSVAAQISEAIWIVPKSIALVQFSKIANLKNDADSAHLTLFLGLVTMLITLVALVALVLIPDAVYTWIFGNEFINLRPIIQLFVPGIFAISLNIILSHFFSGTGKILFNLAGSGLGLIAVAIAGYLMIQHGDITSAALVSSIGYVVNFLFSWVAFLWASRRHVLSARLGYQIFVREKSTI